MTGPEAGVELALQWQIWGWPDEDFVTFVHLVDGEGEIVAAVGWCAAGWRNVRQLRGVRERLWPMRLLYGWPKVNC